MPPGPLPEFSALPELNEEPAGPLVPNASNQTDPADPFGPAEALFSRAGGGAGTLAGGFAIAKPVATKRLPPWIAIIDFAGVHGATTSWLAGQVAGHSASTSLLVLDDPALSSLGPVGDFHVLAKLCQIAEGVDFRGMAAPVAVNMSFGRGLRAGEGNGGPGCDATGASCQVSRVISYLRAKGSNFVASAGNHQDVLFPGSLADVVEVGMLALNAFFASGAVLPAWETPPTSTGLLPGNGLCLGHWAAPAGSSYSAAMFTGWITALREHQKRIDPLTGGAWAPKWHAGLQCYVLSQGAQLFPWCNPKITEIFNGLHGANAGPCWESAGGAGGAYAVAPGQPEAQPGIRSFTTWTTETHPTPESDPCVPCVGSVNLAQSELELNLSQSAAIPEGTSLEGVYLRVGAEFLELSLSPAQLQSIEAGTIGQLVLSGSGSLVAPGEQPSLWYEMKDDPAADCATPNVCFWSSTPIILPGQ